MEFKNFFYILTCLSFSVIIGAGVYEHIAVWPNAFADIPRSLSSFQGEFGLDSAPFWMSIHPVTLLLFIITAVVNWKNERRKFVLIPIVLYVIVLTLTASYFVPELMSLTSTPYSQTSDKALTNRADLWVILSLIRLFFLVTSARILYYGLTKPALKSRV